MNILPPKKIQIINTEKKGRGVFAIKKIFKDEIIEYCPLIILRPKDKKFIKNKKLSDTLYFYYLQQPDLKRDVVMLGYGSLYNHSFEPNAEIDHAKDAKKEYMFFRALRDIKIGEEITWNYEFDDEVEFLPPSKKHRKN